VGRNPKTGKEVPISPHQIIAFKPSGVLKHRVNSEPKNETARAVRGLRRAAPVDAIGTSCFDDEGLEVTLETGGAAWPTRRP
jgi:hypothetical protein